MASEFLVDDDSPKVALLISSPHRLPGLGRRNLTSLGLSVQTAEHVPHQLKRILGRAA